MHWLDIQLGFELNFVLSSMYTIDNPATWTVDTLIGLGKMDEIKSVKRSRHSVMAKRSSRLPVVGNGRNPWDRLFVVTCASIPSRVSVLPVEPVSPAPAVPMCLDPLPPSSAIFVGLETCPGWSPFKHI